MKNELSNSLSPYLLQHKNNPVYWQTWSEDIIKIAKQEKKPIILSIGYASCHWCHVMAHESFEDKETANLMNKYFINIKVDREERPDIDFIFQSSYQLFNQAGGGWPLTMFLDENAVPFMAGTYFPKIEQNGLPSFKIVLQKVYETYNLQKNKIIGQNNLIIKSLELKKSAVLSQDLEASLEEVLSKLDSKKGGYKGSPKFPTFNVFETLLYFYNKSKNEKYIKPVETLLNQLCSQGIYDHVEGGISRYTVDENWLVPHFEKMLYDNVQFVSLLSNYCKVKNNEYFKKKIIQTITFLKAHFLNKENQLLGSAYDADSEGEEGKYYVYNYDEISKIKDIKEFFDVNPDGNWEGKIILRELKPAPQAIINELLKIRNKRKKPFFDNKTQLDLNSLWISSLISADKILPGRGYIQLAEQFYSNIELHFMKSDLFHCNSKNYVFIEDYAFLINALIDLGEYSLNPKYKLEAKKFCEEAITKFYIKEKDIFRKNNSNNNDLFFVPIDISDHTLPNANAIMLTNFTRLGFMEEGKKLSQSLNGYFNNYKNHMVSSIKSLDFFNQVIKGKNCNEQGCVV